MTITPIDLIQIIGLSMLVGHCFFGALIDYLDRVPDKDNDSPSKQEVS